MTPRFPAAMAATTSEPMTAPQERLAFETLFQEQWSKVYRIIFRLVGDHAEAEDLTLEAFWRLYRAHGTDGKLENPTGWLYRVAVNLGYNALRAFKRRGQYEEKAGVHILEDAPDGDPAEALERSQEREQVRIALTALKPRSTKLLILRHSGCSYQEIAQVLQVSYNSVGTLLARAEREFERAYYRLNQGKTR